ncbi:hypothetical protein QN277_020124 [Acacia crassicarpa]|uniref:Uncharacterized protein n=1 Tax=Acacia crassicarpa TaxID=499986 RepID=A0AAE1JNV7_9FABA|nr:hypothetical protein QN277_020124 [Acacia crassicarpa]
MVNSCAWWASFTSLGALCFIMSEDA